MQKATVAKIQIRQMQLQELPLDNDNGSIYAHD